MTLEPEPGHAGGGTGASATDLSPSQPRIVRECDEETSMTVQSKSAARPSTVTTGPIAGSHKIYTSPGGPARHRRCRSARSRWTPRRARNRIAPMTAPAPTPIPRSPSTWKPACRRCAREWLAKRGFDRIAPRAGEARGQRQRRRRQAGARLPGGAAGLWRQARPAGHAIRIRPRRHHHRRNDLRRASREHGPRRRRWKAPRNASPTAKASAPKSPRSSPRNSSAARSPAAAPSFRPTSTTRNSSRSSSAATSW